MLRISKLTLKNFKFFHGSVPINFDNKNVLLYGENGSGKSSIYWALYTFLQSVFKDSPQVTKYFAYNSDVNLRNRFAKNEDESAIIVEFDDGIERVISNEGVKTKTNDDDNVVLEATLGSDLIEYRTLSRIYHFAHSEEIDLFPFFKNNLLPFISFKKIFTTHDGKEGSKSADDFWRYLERGIDIYENAEEDKTFEPFQKIVAEFNSSFDTYLKEITESVNSYLNQKFKQNIKVALKYNGAVGKENLIDEDKKTIFIDEPSIILEVELISAELKADKKKVFNPQSFLNESKLTALALSMRLAILDEKFVEAYPKILVLDDMLMSMDMSNREFVLEIILENYLKDYQILFFTHQRGLFEDAKNFIQSHHAKLARSAGEANEELAKDEWEKHWKVLEMYETENISNFSVPIIQEYGNNLQKALYYFKAHIDYNACGNNLRTALEEFFLAFIPHNFLNGQTMLAGLIVSARSYFTHVGFDTTPLDKLERYRDRSLNPTAHYNPRADYFKRELQDIFSILDSLKKNKNLPLLSKDKKIKFEITAESGRKFTYTAALLDNICLYQKSDGSSSFFKDTDERGYVMIGCTENNSTTLLGHNINRCSLQALYNETVAYINGQGEVVAETNNLYGVFTDENGNSLENMKRY